jgi:hypothetical protein
VKRRRDKCLFASFSPEKEESFFFLDEVFVHRGALRSRRLGPFQARARTRAAINRDAQSF